MKHIFFLLLEIEEIETTSLVDIMIEKSLGNMATEIETVKTNIIEKATADCEQSGSFRLGSCKIWLVVA